ncbi:MAG: phosphotransferase [Candidatus Bathyarchaeia archaeon]|jgi:hypothetical protein
MTEFLKSFVKKNWNKLTTELPEEMPKDVRDIYVLEICSNERGKISFLLFAKNNETPVMVAKLYRESKFDYRLKNEYENLRRIYEKIRRPMTETIPKPLFLGRINGLNFLIESGISGFPMIASEKNAEKHFQLATDWLINFHKATRSCCICTDRIESEYVRFLINQHRRFFTINRDEKQLFDWVLKELEQLKGKKVSISVQHGDFWSHNILLLDQTMKVIDWEDSVSHISSIDIFHFPLWYGFELTKEGIVSNDEYKINALENIYFRDNWFSNLVYRCQKRYFSEFEIDTEMARLLFIVYLLHKSNEEYKKRFEIFEGRFTEQVKDNDGLYRKTLSKIAKSKLLYGEII